MSSIAFVSSAPVRSRVVDWRSFVPAGIGTVLATIAANVTVSLAGGALLERAAILDLLANAGGTVATSTIAASGAVLLYGLLLRWTDNPEQLFATLIGLGASAIVAALAFLIMLVPFFSPTPSAAIGTSTAIEVVVHLTASSAIVWQLTTRAGSRAR
jgi:hypothetical protein